LIHRSSVIVLLGILSSVSCSRPPEPRPTARHLVLVSIDTLRADRVGVYSGGNLTPAIDRIARDGAYAADATSHVPLTRPSHATMFTGLWPWQVGLRDNLSAGTLPSSPLLSEILKNAGFRTAAFVSSIVLGSRGGFARGFDRYDDSFPPGGQDAMIDTLQKPGADIVRQAIAWLEEQRGADRIFLFVHLYEPHDPYEPPEPYASQYRDRPYDGEVAYTDALVDRLDQALVRLDLARDTLLVVTSDHGEGLGEHDETLHGFFVYQTTLAVPLLFRGPGIAPNRRIDETVGLVDLLPTVLDLVGVAIPPELKPAGASLASALGGGPPPPPRAQYAESLVPLLHFGWSDLRVLRDGRWKYILAPRPELYDLATDPHEQRNLAPAQQTRTAALHGGLAKFLEQERGSSAGSARQSVPLDLLERLGALGYVGGSPSTTPTPGADPKDKIADFRRANTLMREGILALNRNDFRSAVRSFDDLIAGGIESFEAHLYLARALMRSAQPARAAGHFEQAARRAPLLEEAWVGWVEARRMTAGPSAAIAVAREGLTKNPRSSQLMMREGEMLRDLGDVDAGLARLHEAVQIDPGNAAAWNALGMTLGGKNRLDEAERAFRTAIARDATDHRYFFNLGLALSRQGRAAEGRQYFEKALELQPGFTPAREELRKLTR
jgi:arylsulfatase A-like enzyme/Tfp pilus assembly protein PilF